MDPPNFPLIVLIVDGEESPPASPYPEQPLTPLAAVAPEVVIISDDEEDPIDWEWAQRDTDSEGEALAPTGKWDAWPEGTGQAAEKPQAGAGGAGQPAAAPSAVGGGEERVGGEEGDAPGAPAPRLPPPPPRTTLPGTAGPSRGRTPIPGVISFQSAWMQGRGGRGSGGAQ